jgi:hypothetical protein
MTSDSPPKFYFNGIIFNSDYYKDETVSGFSQDQADLRYLKKNVIDTAIALETFQGGIKTNSLEPNNVTDTLNINTVSTTATNIINIGNDTTNNQTLNLNSKTINIGDTSVPSAVNIIPASTFTGIATFNNAVTTATVNAISQGTVLTIGGNQIASGGILNIGTNQIGRVGPINICNTLTTGVGQIINIGSNVITTGTQTINLGGAQTISGGGSQTINVNKPLTIGYTVNPTSLNQIGGTTFIDAAEQPYPSTGSSLTLATISTIPIGIYQVFYNISTTITIATATITERTITISSVSADTIPANTIDFMRNSDLLHQTRVVGHDLTVTGGGLFVNTTSSASIYLNQRYIFSTGPTIRAKGYLRVVRIG